jgi:hypothetical protein
MLYNQKSIQRGPGIKGLKTMHLKKPSFVEAVRNELATWIDSIPNNWTPHQKWEFCKVGLYTIASKQNTSFISAQDARKVSLVKELTKLKILIAENSSQHVNQKIATIEAELEDLYEQEAESLFLQSGLKWREEGERSTKYFLGLVNKKRLESSLTQLYDHNGILVDSVKGMLDIAKNFYKRLYSKVYVNTDKNLLDDFFLHSPKLDNNKAKILEEDITEENLKETLKTCNDSSPGPDGIPYSYYKAFADILITPLLMSWKFSMETGTLSPSQQQACISLLPKTGKDKTRIENWRPISLSNCDMKIVTKTLALRLNKILDDVISPCQSAYIPGRNITNNIRILKTCRKYANLHQTNMSIVSLDAKKAFDSVDHSYIKEALKRYGFGPKFIHTFETLYKSNQSSVIVNGFKSATFDIKRGVKQGDALSCGLFILAIDPLLRKIENCAEIEPFTMTSNNRRRLSVRQKVLAYADDITVITTPTNSSIQAIFDQYNKLSLLSGLTLNADKTEIINSQAADIHFNVTYNGNNFGLSPLNNLVICGIMFSNNENTEYEYNVLRRISEMETQLKKWLCRNLTLNGRNIVAKTYGMSQLIYTFQCCEVKEKELIEIERIYFKFLWSKKWEVKAPDRIKRAILKNSKENGGLNCMDVKSLYQALALRNILQSTLKPEKNEIQKWLNDITGLSSTSQETSEMSAYDPITKTAQGALNQITKYYRQSNFGEKFGVIQTKMLEQALNTNLPTFARINNYPILRQQLARIHNIKTLKDLINNMTGTAINLHDNTFNLLPTYLKNLKDFHNQALETPSQLYFLHNDKAISAADIKTSQLQSILKTANNKTTQYDISMKFNLEQNPNNNAIFPKLYKEVKDPKLRAIRYRILQGDVFSKDRMKKFGMTDDDKCERCGLVETKDHQLFECRYAKLMWKEYNLTMRQMDLREVEVHSLEQAIIPSNSSNYLSETLKSVVLKANIQINRPKHNLSVAISNLFQAQARIENIVSNRTQSVRNKKRQNKSLWYKLLLTRGNT